MNVIVCEFALRNSTQTDQRGQREINPKTDRNRLDRISWTDFREIRAVRLSQHAKLRIRQDGHYPLIKHSKVQRKSKKTWEPLQFAWSEMQQVDFP